MATRANYSGLVIAGIGFVLTRFTVTLALYEDPVRFYLGGVVPLVLGLGLAAFGVALVVADVDPALVRTTAEWCVVGAVAMLMLVVLTLVATDPSHLFDPAAVRSQTYLSNFLIGGSVGGTLTGLYAATNERQRVELRHQANRLEVLNRMLRHEVLNAVTVIRGHASLKDAGTPEIWAAIEDRSAAIERTIEEVKYLARSARTADRAVRPVEVAPVLESSLESLGRTHPAADVAVEALPADVAVLATGHLDRVFTNLLEAAVANVTADGPAVCVSVTAAADTVRTSIRYAGPPLRENQRALLERGEIDQYDNPAMGFSLNVARLLVENYRGAIEVDSREGAETITVVLPRARANRPGARPAAFGLPGILPAVPRLAMTLCAALVAGVAYGVVSELLGGSVAGIGVFYGTADPVVGWITHEFHSIVFGFVYLGLVMQAPARFRDGYLGCVAIALGWAVVLWLVAAGIVAPVWLRLLGIPAPIPNLSWMLLWSHLAWGLTLGLLMAWGQRHVLPRLA